MKEGVQLTFTREGLSPRWGGDYVLQKVPFQFGTATVLQLLMEKKVGVLIDGDEPKENLEADSAWGLNEVSHISWGKFLDNFRRTVSFIRFHLRDGNSLYFTEPFWLWQFEGDFLILQGKRIRESSKQILSLVERRGFVHHLM
ncbi:MAG: hypothetical protein Kow0037_25010 [Calditrichia bacterium]